MAKARKAAKKQKKAALDLKEVTAGKILRTFLKIFALSMLVALILPLAETLLGWQISNKIWLQFGFMFLIFMIARPFIMSEFRPKK